MIAAFEGKIFRIVVEPHPARNPGYPGYIHPIVELMCYLEVNDDGNWIRKMTFHPMWLEDLKKITSDCADVINAYYKDGQEYADLTLDEFRKKLGR